jgi:peptidoglycan LD-endopeptidase LytH
MRGPVRHADGGTLGLSPMCVRRVPPRSFVSGLITALIVVVLLAGWPVLAPAATADPRLEQAQAKRVQMQARLDTVMQRVTALEAETSETEAELASLRDREAEQAEAASTASGLFAARIRESYMRGTADPMLDLLSIGSPEQAADQARALNLLAVRSQAELESASAARTRTKATAEHVAEVAARLAEQREELERVRAEAAQLVAQAQQEEQQVEATIAREQAERERQAREAREARERAAQQRAQRERASRTAAASSPPASAPTAAASSSGGGSTSSAPVSGGVACPVGNPRNYSDTYGAPRSGGRAHKGVDILAPRGTPIYAYESGTISRMNSNRLGGISLYLRGDSGTTYYYTHLQGYVSGLSTGQRVSVGQQIAYNGDTGNARGIPHLHWEVMPGGGGNVNPYPYAKRACG